MKQRMYRVIIAFLIASISLYAEEVPFGIVVEDYVQDIYVQDDNEIIIEQTFEQLNQVKPIVVVVCSYNNSQWSANTLDSIFSQDYPNFRLIIVDDCSSDGNQQVIQRYIDEHNLHDRVTFIQNNKRHRKLYNLYRALYLCDDEEIVVMVDGDDYLADKNVFSRLSALYDDENVWFTYGQYRNVPASEAILWGHKEMGYCRQVPKYIQLKRAYRFYSFIYMHPRSFRAWLFKLVKLEDLIADKIKGFEGDFYPASNDVAMYFPMVEMAHTRIKFISDILYIRNLYSDIVGFKVDRKIQTESAREIRKKNSYNVLFRPKKNRLDKIKTAQADIIIVCKYDLSSIESMIENMYEMIQDVGEIHILFPGSIDNKTIARTLKKKYQDIIFFSYGNEDGKELKNRLIDSLGSLENDHVVMTTDFFTIVKPLSLNYIIYWLERTYASKFYLSRDSSKSFIPRYIHLDDDVCVWKIHSGRDTWRGMRDCEDVVLYQKDILLNVIKKLTFDSAYGLVSELHKTDIFPSRIALFCYHRMITPFL